MPATRNTRRSTRSSSTDQRPPSRAGSSSSVPASSAAPTRTSRRLRGKSADIDSEQAPKAPTRASRRLRSQSVDEEAPQALPMKAPPRKRGRPTKKAPPVSVSPIKEAAEEVAEELSGEPTGEPIKEAAGDAAEEVAPEVAEVSEQDQALLDEQLGAGPRVEASDGGQTPPADETETAAAAAARLAALHKAAEKERRRLARLTPRNNSIRNLLGPNRKRRPQDDEALPSRKKQRLDAIPSAASPPASSPLSSPAARYWSDVLIIPRLGLASPEQPLAPAAAAPPPPSSPPVVAASPSPAPDTPQPPTTTGLMKYLGSLRGTVRKLLTPRRPATERQRILAEAEQKQEQTAAAAEEKQQQATAADEEKQQQTAAAIEEVQKQQPGQKRKRMAIDDLESIPMASNHITLNNGFFDYASSDDEEGDMAELDDNGVWQPVRRFSLPKESAQAPPQPPPAKRARMSSSADTTPARQSSALLTDPAPLYPTIETLPGEDPHRARPYRGTALAFPSEQHQPHGNNLFHEHEHATATTPPTTTATPPQVSTVSKPAPRGYRVPDFDSDSDTDPEDESIVEWKQPPPPTPHPAHASLPADASPTPQRHGSAEVSSAHTFMPTETPHKPNDPEALARLRLQAEKYKPKTPSGLRAASNLMSSPLSTPDQASPERTPAPATSSSEFSWPPLPTAPPEWVQNASPQLMPTPAPLDEFNWPSLPTGPPQWLQDLDRHVRSAIEAMPRVEMPDYDAIFAEAEQETYRLGDASRAAALAL